GQPGLPARDILGGIERLDVDALGRVPGEVLAPDLLRGQRLPIVHALVGHAPLLLAALKAAGAPPRQPRARRNSQAASNHSTVKPAVNGAATGASIATPSCTKAVALIARDMARGRPRASSVPASAAARTLRKIRFAGLLSSPISPTARLSHSSAKPVSAATTA